MGEGRKACTEARVAICYGAWCSTLISAALTRLDSKMHKTTLFRWPLAGDRVRDLGLGLKRVPNGTAASFTDCWRLLKNFRSIAACWRDAHRFLFSLAVARKWKKLVELARMQAWNFETARNSRHSLASPINKIDIFLRQDSLNVRGEGGGSSVLFLQRFPDKPHSEEPRAARARCFALSSLCCPKVLPFFPVKKRLRRYRYYDEARTRQFPFPEASTFSDDFYPFFFLFRLFTCRRQVKGTIQGRIFLHQYGEGWLLVTAALEPRVMRGLCKPRPSRRHAFKTTDKRTSLIAS